jgi:CheY-like chemotaxis protein
MKSLHIALVDDDEVINLVHREVIKRIVPQAVIDVFRSGPQLIAYLEGDGYAPVDYLFLDIRMPEMDGFEVLSKLKTLNKPEIKSAKIYVLSSTLDERDLSRAKNDDWVDDFIGKPLSFVTIQQLLINNSAL